jgi:hypothetical protein
MRLPHGLAILSRINSPYMYKACEDTSHEGGIVVTPRVIPRCDKYTKCGGAGQNEWNGATWQHNGSDNSEPVTTMSK